VLRIDCRTWSSSVLRLPFQAQGPVRGDDVKGFAVLPKRWIVERTFAWLNRYRRLSKDYETLVDSSETMIQLAMINLMVHRLKPG
jgi:putative transposase